MKISPKMLAVLVFVGGLVVIVYQVYELDRFRRDIWAMKPRTAVLPQQAKLADKATLAELAGKHLMGNPSVQSHDQVVVQKPVIDTNLNLELVGIIRGGFDGKDSALIRIKNKETKRYFVGEQVEGGALLESVSDDSVTLKRGGAVQVLKYPNSLPPALPPQSSSSAAVPLTSDDANATNEPSSHLTLRDRLMLRAKQ